jgi:hypothetical protein
LVKMKDGKIAEWKGLGKVMALAGDKPAFSTYVRDGIQNFLETNKPAASEPPVKSLPAIPLPK